MGPRNAGRRQEYLGPAEARLVLYNEDALDLLEDGVVLEAIVYFEVVKVVFI